MRSWATEELKYAALPDKRLNKRLIKIVENLAGQPHASIPQASGAIRKHKSDLQFLAIVTNRSTRSNRSTSKIDIGYNLQHKQHRSSPQRSQQL